MATAEWNSIDKYEESFPVYNCAFLDILGYKQRAEDYFNNKFNLYGRINRALSATAMCMAVTAPLLDSSDLTVEIFSDSIIIMQPNTGRGLRAILPFSCQFASTLSFEGLFIRGGIAQGHHARRRTDQGFDFLASEALQKAYQLEHEKAINPRTILDADVIEQLTREEKNIVVREKDDFILHFAHHVISRDGLNRDKVHAEMVELQEEMQKYANHRTKAKYQWLLDYYYWTIQQNPAWDTASFVAFYSGEDRGFAKLEANHDT